MIALHDLPTAAAARAAVRLARLARLAVPLALAAAGCGGGGAGERPRNLLLISLDTLRPDHLGCYGRGRDTSPQIDALAARGVRFSDVTSASPWTLPSHATMLTGLYPSSHGVKDHLHRLSDETVTLAEEFKEQGFQTFAVVNTYNIAEPAFALAQGFDVFEYVSEQNARKDADGNLMVDELGNVAKDIINAGETVTSKARGLLEGRDEDEPFFLFLHFYDAHTDFTPAQEYVDKFVAPYGGRMNGKTGQLHGIRSRGEQLSEADIRWLKEMYDAEIRQLDDVLARFFDFLEEEGVADETLVVVTSDHGEEFFEHGGLLHGRTQYQELLAIPLVFSGPGVPAGRVIDTPAHLVDVTPTVLAIFGFEPGMRRDGLDLTALWRAAPAFPPERLLFGEADHNNLVDGKEVIDIKHMVRDGSLKLHQDRVTGGLQLYDLARDPGEKDDLAAREAAKAAALQAELTRFQNGGRESLSGMAPEDLNVDLLEDLGYGGKGDPEETGTQAEPDPE